ncbi:MAG: hypothetical protein EOP49_01415 [Sphingobacteriales bacterium]|nr:MAG: hypothetical protein EOP49_01415 [Sphingobacteriales bacterium]
MLKERLSTILARFVAMKNCGCSFASEMRTVKIAICVGIVSLSFSACKVSKTSSYFKTLHNDTTIAGFVNPNLEVKIRKGDNLGISINSLSVEENKKFNNLVISEGVSGATVPSYAVSANGTIKMHRFGEIKVEGMTKRELAEKLQKDLLPYLKEPIVNVSFLNHKVTVIGSVARPQVLTLTDESLPILDALAISGDIVADGRRDHVLVIRDSADQRLVKKLNLEDHSVFSSPFYYLQPNDIVYVAPNYEKAEKDERRRSLQTTLGLAMSGISLVIIIIDRLLR